MIRRTGRSPARRRKRSCLLRNPSRPTLQERVAARIGTLTATERRVAEYLSSHPQEAAFSSAEELGRATGTSDAQRRAHRQGARLRRPPGLKRSLQGHLQSLLTPANRLSASLETIGSSPEVRAERDAARPHRATDPG